MKGMDPSHVVLVDLNLLAECFEEHEASDSRSLGLDLIELNVNRWLTIHKELSLRDTLPRHSSPENISAFFPSTLLSQ